LIFMARFIRVRETARKWSCMDRIMARSKTRFL
jgi:hypothetical protein